MFYIIYIYIISFILYITVTQIQWHDDVYIQDEGAFNIEDLKYFDVPEGIWL